MWIWHPCSNVKTKFLIIFDFVITNLDAPVLADLDKRFAENTIQNWVNGFTDINKQYLRSHSYSCNNFVHMLRILCISNDKFFIVFIPSLDPIHALGLWIDVQSPTQTFRNEASVFAGKLVCGQTIDLPLTLLRRIGHKVCKAETIGVGNFRILDLHDPI